MFLGGNTGSYGVHLRSPCTAQSSSGPNSHYLARLHCSLSYHKTSQPVYLVGYPLLIHPIGIEGDRLWAFNRMTSLEKTQLYLAVVFFELRIHVPQ